MRYGAIPDSLTERLALWAGKVPLPIVDAIFPLVKARSLMAAARVGVFQALSGGPLTAETLAGRLRLDPESLELMLRVLAASGYLGASRGGFRLTALARRTLLKGGALECLGYLRFNYTQWKFLDHLEELLATGRGLDFHRTMQGPEEWENYQRGMLEIARTHAPILARHVPVRPDALRLLDLAGSHGLLGAAICRRHPPLRSMVLDLPQALEPARKLAHEEGVDGLVEFAAADLRREELPAGVDVILCANILHHFSPEENLDLLRRAQRALAPRGTLAIWDIADRASAQPELGRDATALFFRLTSTSRCFGAVDYRKWLVEAGFSEARTVRSPLAPLHMLIHARKPG